MKFQKSFCSEIKGLMKGFATRSLVMGMVLSLVFTQSLGATTAPSNQRPTVTRTIPVPAQSPSSPKKPTPRRVPVTPKLPAPPQSPTLKPTIPPPTRGVIPPQPTRPPPRPISRDVTLLTTTLKATMVIIYDTPIIIGDLNSSDEQENQEIPKDVCTITANNGAWDKSTQICGYDFNTLNSFFAEHVQGKKYTDFAKKPLKIMREIGKGLAGDFPYSDWSGGTGELTESGDVATYGGDSVIAIAGSELTQNFGLESLTLPNHPITDGFRQLTMSPSGKKAIQFFTYQTFTTKDTTGGGGGGTDCKGGRGANCGGGGGDIGGGGQTGETPFFNGGYQIIKEGNQYKFHVDVTTNSTVVSVQVRPDDQKDWTQMKKLPNLPTNGATAAPPSSGSGGRQQPSSPPTQSKKIPLPSNKGGSQ